MKKFCLSLGLSLFLACWCGEGYYGFGTGIAFGQYYGSRHLSCDPRDPSCYRDYHATPYADPLSQFLYYFTSPVSRNQRYKPGQVLPVPKDQTPDTRTVSAGKSKS